VSEAGVLAFVDAIDEGIARLVIGTRTFELPAEVLPAGTREGTWVRLAAMATPAPPDDTEARRRALGADDPGGDIKL